MGEAQKVKDRFVVVPSRAVWPEVHEAGLGLVEFKPVAAQPFTQNVKQALGAPAVLKGEHKSSRPGESHPEALTEPCLNLSAHTAPPMQPYDK